MKAKRRPWVNDEGTVWPCRRFKVGLGSNNSRWLGPPHWNKKITDFALAGKWPRRGRSGLAAVGVCAKPSRSKSEARAIEPRPMLQSRRKWRRATVSSSAFSYSGRFIRNAHFQKTSRHFFQAVPIGQLQ